MRQKAPWTDKLLPLMLDAGKPTSSAAKVRPPTLRFRSADRGARRGKFKQCRCLD